MESSKKIFIRKVFLAIPAYADFLKVENIESLLEKGDYNEIKQVLWDLQSDAKSLERLLDNIKIESSLES